jgi:hypothetical protein
MCQDSIVYCDLSPALHNTEIIIYKTMQNIKI